MIVTCIIVFLCCYVWHAMGTTIGYHRLLSHRSFKCPKFVEYFWVLGGYLGFEGSPIWWSAIHRAHHKYDDTPLDPHSPRYGLKNALYGWMTRHDYPEHIDPIKSCPDITNDALYRFLEFGGDWNKAHSFNFAFGFAVRGLVWALFGWQIALASLLAGLAVLSVPLMLNVVCHQPKLGYRNFAINDDSTNVWWVAVLAMGEGWHNNHHAFPGSARSGLKPYEFDPSWLVLRAMKVVGLVGYMNEVKARSNNRWLIPGAKALHRYRRRRIAAARTAATSVVE